MAEIDDRPDTDLPPVYAVTYDHIGVILWGVEKLEDSLDKELEWLERHPDFRVGWDHEAWAYDYLAEHCPPLLEKMKAALARFPGRLGVGSCTYGQPLSMFIDGESNIRQLTFALEATEKHLDYRQSVYVISEHAFHAQLPQLLVGVGFRGVILRTHFMMYGHNPEYDEPVGWWIGVDGSRIATLPTYRGQAATPARSIYKIPGNTSTLDNRILTDSPSATYPLTLADFRHAFGRKIQPLIATRADDVRNREELIVAHEGDPDYRWILLEEVFDLLPPPRAEFRTQPNEFKVRMPWGYCGNWIWQRARRAEVQVQAAERLAAIGHALGGDGHEEKLRQAWQNLLVGQHHDIHICGLLDDAEHYLGMALDLSHEVIADVLATVAPRIGQGKRQVVFNPLAWKREEWIATSQGGTVVTAPGLGFAVQTDDSAPHYAEPIFLWQADEGCLTTPFYQVYIGHKGGFRLLRDRKNGQDLLFPPKDSGTLAGLVDGRFCESVGRITLQTIETGRTILAEEGEIGGIPYRHQWTFYAHTQRIDWCGEITFSRQAIGRAKHAEEMPDLTVNPTSPDAEFQKIPAYNDHEYKLRLRFFPYLSPYATGIRDYPFGIAETDDRYVHGVYWTAVSDGHVGLALFNRGCMGSIREPDGAFSSLLAFSMPYVWHTRVLEGSYTYELGIYPFVGNWRNADLLRRALEYNFPVVTADVEKMENSLGPAWTPFHSESQAILSALYTRDGQTYLRFCEQEGKAAEVAFHWMGQPAELVAVDLRERRQGRLGRRLQLGPWQVQTVTRDGE